MKEATLAVLASERRGKAWRQLRSEGREAKSSPYALVFFLSFYWFFYEFT
jgi:hypothetical protein